MTRVCELRLLLAARLVTVKLQRSTSYAVSPFFSEPITASLNESSTLPACTLVVQISLAI